MGPKLGKRLRIYAASGLAALLGLAALGSLSAAPAPSAGEAEQQAVLKHLNDALTWYRSVQAGDHWVFQPSDEFFWGNQHALANQALQEAFLWGEAEAQALAAEEGAAGGRTNATATATEKRLAEWAETTAAQVREIQAQIAALSVRMRVATPEQMPALTAQREALQGEFDLQSAYQESIQKYGTLLSGSDETSGSATLTARINILKRSLPQAFTPVPANSAGKPAIDAAPAKGIVQQVALLITLTRDRHQLAVLGEATGPTAKLKLEADSLASPLREWRDRIMQEGSGASGRISTDDLSALGTTRRTLESLAAQFKLVATGLLALRQESIALEQSRDNVREWRTSFDRRYDEVVRELLGRALMIGVFLFLLALGSEIWRRATFRYVSDLRRRRQFLIMRRFTTGILMSIVVILGLVSNFGSLATYAGLITAGVAVALQSVILSLAGYFLLIGRYGIRVGDRVTVAGVTGDVIDVGPVRFYMMELAASTGIVLQPTGRLIVLPNSVLFNTTPLYKQIPGTDYAWHTMAVALTPEADQALVEAKLLGVVNAVYSEYRPSLERQHDNVERLIDVRLDVPKPVAHLGYVDSGLELVVRYPVDLHRMAEMDEAISRQVQQAIAADPKLQQGISGTPHIRAAIKT